MGENEGCEGALGADRCVRIVATRCCMSFMQRREPRAECVSLLDEAVS